jgi:hypothetical protein
MTNPTYSDGTPIFPMRAQPTDARRLAEELLRAITRHGKGRDCEAHDCRGVQLQSIVDMLTLARAEGRREGLEAAHAVVRSLLANQAVDAFTLTVVLDLLPALTDPPGTETVDG